MALARYNGVALTVSGASIVVAPLASVEVRREDTGALASLFSDRDGLVGKTNPFAADAYGRFDFCVAALEEGFRIRVVEASSPGLEYTLRNVPIGTAGEFDINDFWALLLACTDADAVKNLLDAAEDDPIAFSVYRSGNQNSVNSVFTLVQFDVIEWNVGGYFETGSPSTSRFTPPAGRYQLGGFVNWAAGGDQNQFALDIYKNGNAFKVLDAGYMSGASGAYAGGSVVVEANGTDYFDLRAFQTTGADRTLSGGQATLYFWGKRIAEMD